MKRREAFTLVELILVIIVIAILAANSIPRLKRDTRVEAMNHILTMIRYTQNLALHDSKHSIDSSKWQKSYWRMQFYQCSTSGGWFYSIGTDQDYSGGYVIANNEAAIDPSNGKLMTWNKSNPCPKDANTIDRVSPNIFISQKYGINSVNFRGCSIVSGTSGASIIAFDNFGRPFRGLGDESPSYKNLVKTDCKIDFSFEDSSITPFTIVIPKESGYAYIEGKKSL